MQDIVIDIKGRFKGRCRFSSVQDIVDYYVSEENENNIVYALRDAVQYNVEYRDFLRENGIPALMERLKADTPHIERHPEIQRELAEWWTGIEEAGGLGDYDIQCLETGDPISVFGTRINGLKGLWYLTYEMRKASPCTGKKPQEVRDMPDANESYDDDFLYVALLWNSYPRFDISDFGDNREYRCYYIRNHRIGPDFFLGDEPGGMQHVKEDIPVSYLPMVYHDGDSPVMYLMKRKESN